MKLSEVITGNKQSAKADYQSETLIFGKHRIPSSLPCSIGGHGLRTRTQSNRRICGYYREDREQRAGFGHTPMLQTGTRSAHSWSRMVVCKQRARPRDRITDVGQG